MSIRRRKPRDEAEDAANQERVLSVAKRLDQLEALLLRHERPGTIAEALGTDLPGVERDVAAVRAEWEEAAARPEDSQRVQELAALRSAEQLLRRDLDGIKSSRERCRIVDRLIALQERRAALIGLDAPKKHHVHQIIDAAQSGGINIQAIIADPRASALACELVERAGALSGGSRADDARGSRPVSGEGLLADGPAPGAPQPEAG